MDITKILVAGIGAVGGFFGATLAHHYEDDNKVNIYFLARGEHLNKIQKQGLKVVHGENSFFAKKGFFSASSQYKSHILVAMTFK